MIRIAVLGFGREGKSVLKFLKRSPQFRGAHIEVLDKKLDKKYLNALERFDLIFRSPGVPYNLPELVRARKNGVRFSSATELFFENSPTKNIIGVTGTKGKGTTSTLLHKILKGADFKVHLAGNIGKPALDLLPRLKKSSWVILELSSFQLQDLKKSPRIAVVLDVFPDHQDAHLNLREYYSAKTNVARHQKPGDKIFFFASNPKSRSIAQNGRGKRIAISEKGWGLFAPEDLKIPGCHNFKNAVMAATVAKFLGVSNKIILKTVKRFRGLEHRLGFVRTIKTKLAPYSVSIKRHPGILKYLRILFYNDSASTNPHTTAAAIRAFAHKNKELRIKNKAATILIAGGQDKGLDYKPLAKALEGTNTKLVVLYGENKRKIAVAILRIKNKELRIKLVRNLKRAISAAYNFARKSFIRNSLFVILFSPGAASFDQFQNYADRGRRFKKFVKALK